MQAQVVRKTKKVNDIIKKKLKQKTRVYSLDTAHRLALVADSVSSAPVLAKVKYLTVLNVLDKIAIQLCFSQVQSHIFS